MKKSFVEVVEKMVDEGHDLKTVEKNLQTLGLKKTDAEKLVEIMEKKSVPKVQQKIEDLVRKKIISVESAAQLKLERRAISNKRRENAKLAKVFKLGDSFVREHFPGKHLAFKQRWRKLAAAKQQEEQMLKEMQALFLEMEKGELPYRVKNKLGRILKELE